MSEKRDLTSLSELAEPLRRRLYDYVVSRRTTVTKDDAARALGIGRSVAAYHLERLLSAGLLTASYARTSGRSGPGAGRTAKLYRRSDREFAASEPARDYERLAVLLADTIERDRSDTMRQTAAETAYDEGVRMARKTTRRTAVAALQERGYLPVDDGAVIRLANCPFHRLAQSHRNLVCGLNQHLITGLLDGLQERTLRAALEPHPEHCCVTLVHATS